MFELVTASFAAQDENMSLREDWAVCRNRLHGAFGVLQGIGGDQFLQAVALLTTQKRRREGIEEGLPQNRVPAINCRKNDILSLDVSDYHEWAARVEQGFMEAAKFLHSQYIFTRNDVPYNTQLVPLAALYVELGDQLAPAMARAKLERWFWSGIFGEVYGGAVETQFGLDLAQVANWVRGGPQPVLVGEANFIPERLLSLRTRNSAAYKGLYALQMKERSIGLAHRRTTGFCHMAPGEHRHPPHLSGCLVRQGEPTGPSTPVQFDHQQDPHRRSYQQEDRRQRSVDLSPPPGK